MMTREALRTKLVAAYEKTGLPVEGEWSAFYEALLPTYEEVVRELKLVGYSVHGQYGGDDNYMDGLDVLPPLGEVGSIPDPCVDGDTEFSAVDKVVDFFLGLPRFTVTPELPAPRRTPEQIRDYLKFSLASIGVPLGPWHEFYKALLPVYGEILKRLELEGYVLSTKHESDVEWIDGLVLELPDGVRRVIPDPLVYDEQEFSKIDDVVAFFFGFLPAAAAPPPAPEPAEHNASTPSDEAPLAYMINTNSATAAIAELVKAFVAQNPGVGQFSCTCHDGTKVVIKLKSEYSRPRRR